MVKTKRAFLYGPHDLRIEEVELPPLQPDQVLIKMGACGICGSDVECYEGKSKEGRYDIAPYTPGHEWCGEVVEVGKNVTDIHVGKKVAGDCNLACGKCYNCKSGLHTSACNNFRETGFRPDSPGGMSEYMIIEEQYIYELPDDWSFVEGAWYETFSIGYYGIWGRDGTIDASDYAAVLGCGPVGICATMVCATSGAKTIVVDPLPARRELALKYGADAALDPTASDYKQQMLDATEGHGPSVIAEVSGNDKSVQSIFEIAGHGCRVNLIGHTVGRKIPIEIGLTQWRTLHIKGAGGTYYFGPRTIRFMNRIHKKYDLKALNTHYFKFDQIQEAFNVAVHDKANAFKVMLTF